MLLQTSSICSIFNASPTPHVTYVVNLQAKTPEKANFGLGLTTFVTRSANLPEKTGWFDDVCNIATHVHPDRLRTSG